MRGRGGAATTGGHRQWSSLVEPREHAVRTGRRQHGVRGAVVVGGALYAGLLGLVGDAAVTVSTCGAGQAQALHEQLEAGAADAVLDDGLACLVQCARVRLAGSALQVGDRVLEGVDRTFGVESREVAATELASVANATRVRPLLVAELADTVDP